MNAISAAGVMHALTKNCSMGELSHCGCDDSNVGKMGTDLTAFNGFNHL